MFLWILLGTAAFIVAFYGMDAWHARRVAKAISSYEAGLSFNAQGVIQGQESFFRKEGDTACLLIHGFRGSPAVFRELAEFLATNGISVNAILLPGHGRRVSELGATRWANWASAVENAYFHLKDTHRKVFVVGFSLGGLLALRLAARHAIHGVVTVSPLLQVHPNRFGSLRPLSQLRLARLLLFTRVRVRKFEPDIQDPAARKQVNGHSFYPLETSRSLLEFSAGSRDEIGQIHCPLLMLLSPKDAVIDASAAQEYFDRVTCPDKVLQCFEDSGHELLLDREKVPVSQAIFEFIKSHS